MPNITLWNGRTIPRLGLGCWAIGGPFFTPDGSPLGWGAVDDKTSIRAVQHAIELGLRFFDTADVYGAGHSETLLGRALAGAPDDVVVASKFGNRFDPASKILTGPGASPEYIRSAVDASLKRLRRERIDLYQLHIDDLADGPAEAALDCLQTLRREGKIDAFGWSTDYLHRARQWAGQAGFVAVQHALNVFTPAAEMLAFCETQGLLSVNRSPLAMGLLTGKYDAQSRLGDDDIRSKDQHWLRWFDNGRPSAEFLDRLAAAKNALRSDGRSLAQGAIGWIWAQSPQTLPIVGFRSAEQVAENAAALRFGALPAEALSQIAEPAISSA